MTILRSTGPVISTRRSWMSAGTGAHVHSASRTARRLGQEIGQPTGVELRLARRTPRQELGAALAEDALQPRDEADRLRREDLGVLGRDAAGHLDAGAERLGGHCHFLMREGEAVLRRRRTAGRRGQF